MASPAGPVEHSGPRQRTRTLILISARLGCIATRCKSAAMSRNSCLYVSLTPPSSPSSSFLSHRGTITWDHHQSGADLTSWFSDIHLLHNLLRLVDHELGPPPPQPRLRTRPPPPRVYGTFSLEKAEKSLTHRVINSIPGLEDSPRKPLLVQELPKAAKTDQVKQVKPGAQATNKNTNTVSCASQPENVWVPCCCQRTLFNLAIKKKKNGILLISASPVWDIEIISYFPCNQISFQLICFFTALRSKVVFVLVIHSPHVYVCIIMQSKLFFFQFSF